MSKSGYLYIIANDDIPGWIKVGITENLEKRLNQYQTCHPNRSYKILYSLYHPNYKEAEMNIKETMKHFAKTIKNEWYEISLHMAKSRLEEQLEEYQQSS
jgi:predicted GIY-YIG superfamily endonuclease